MRLFNLNINSENGLCVVSCNVRLFQHFCYRILGAVCEICFGTLLVGTAT